MARALTYGVRWAAVAGLVGAVVGLLSAVAGVVAGSTGTRIAVWTLWSLSGVAVGAAQWAVVRGRMRLSPIRWIAATAIAPLGFVVFILLVTAHGVIQSAGYLEPSAAYAPAFIVQGVVTAAVCGLILGGLQAAALRDASIDWLAWICATMLGVLAAWVFNLALLFLFVPTAHGGFSKPNCEACWIAELVGPWIMLCLPQAFLIGRAADLHIPTVSHMATDPAEADARSRT